MVDASLKEIKSVEFSTAASGELSKSGKAPRRTSKQLQKRGSSFFHQLSASFRRSKGERGADVDTLRGTHGPDFEGYSMINRGEDMGVGCGCFGGGRDKMERLVLIKGPFIFVFLKESDKAPAYAVSLAQTKGKSHGLSGGSHIVVLESGLGDVEYEFGFEAESIAKQFVEAVNQQAAVGQAEAVRKRLGHDKILSKRSSIRFAEKIALKKVDKQPEKPEHVTMEDFTKVSGGPGMAMFPS